jgi:S1-C subfamily serine protease
MVYQLDIVAYPGNSGSPVYLSNSGDVFAVINKVFVNGTREAALSMPSGITYAIPIKHVYQLAEKHGISLFKSD